jgi:hypothetical protein
MTGLCSTSDATPIRPANVGKADVSGSVRLATRHHVPEPPGPAVPARPVAPSRAGRAHRIGARARWPHLPHSGTVGAWAGWRGQAAGWWGTPVTGRTRTSAASASEGASAAATSPPSRSTRGVHSSMSQVTGASRSAGVSAAAWLSHAWCINGVRGFMSVRSNASASHTPAVVVARRNIPATSHASADPRAGFPVALQSAPPQVCSGVSSAPRVQAWVSREARRSRDHRTGCGIPLTLSRGEADGPTVAAP